MDSESSTAPNLESQNTGTQTGNGVSGKNAFKNIAAIPKQYNISFVETLIRDPLWTFVFWEIKSIDRDMYENAAGFNGYCLRVVPLKGDGSLKESSPLNEGGLLPEAALPFTVAVDKNDSGRYLAFPPNGWYCYKVELCVLLSDNCTVLAASCPFVLPRLIQPRLEAASMALGQDEEIQALYRNPLAQLSGIDDFLLFRSIDRRPRIFTENI
jgi:hypothetical protein